MNNFYYNVISKKYHIFVRCVHLKPINTRIRWIGRKQNFQMFWLNLWFITSQLFITVFEVHLKAEMINRTIYYIYSYLFGKGKKLVKWLWKLLNNNRYIVTFIHSPPTLFLCFLLLFSTLFLYKCQLLKYWLLNHWLKFYL